jgi:hypothetical protein
VFEQVFKNIDHELRKDAGCGSELDYGEQSSWILFLKSLEDLERDRAAAASLSGKPYQPILSEQYRWSSWAAPRNSDGQLDHHNALTGEDLCDSSTRNCSPTWQPSSKQPPIALRWSKRLGKSSARSRTGCIF